MDTDNSRKIPVYFPASPEEAARFLGECSSIKRSGHPLSVSVLESPFQAFRSDESLRRIGSAGQIPLASAENGGRRSDGSGGPVAAAVSLREMDRIIEVSRDDRLVFAESGVLLSRLRDEAGSRGLFLPFEEEAPFGDRTAGELLMDGTSSRLEGRYGRLRECILSVEIAAAAGELIHSGSRSVKDVTGYEIAGFLAGAGGRGGVATRIAFRLLPAPARVASAAFGGSFEALFGLARKIRIGDWPASLELFNSDASGILTSAKGSRFGDAREGESLLLSETHSAGGKTGKKMIEALHPLPGGVRIIAEDFSIRKAKEDLLSRLTAQGGGCGAVRVAADADRPFDATGAGIPSWTRLFPHRTSFVRANEPGGAPGVPSTVMEMLGRSKAPSAPVMMELMEMRGERMIVTRIDPPAERTGMSARRVLAVFDPEGIMER